MVDKLYLGASQQRYNQHDYDLLATALQRLLDDTRIIPIPPLSDLLLSLDRPGHTTAGWRYSQQGLYSILRKLAPGFQTVIDSVAGHSRHSRYAVNSYDVRVASKLFNDLLSLRYGDISRRRIMICGSSRLIDGFVRHVNKHLDSHVFLTIVNTAMLARGFQFAGASLHHRRLGVWFREPGPGITVKLDHTTSHAHWRGFYAGHNEALDAVSHRADPLHISPAVLWTDGCTFRKRGSRSSLYRSKRAVTDLLPSAVDRAFDNLCGSRSLAANLSRLTLTPLGVTDLKTDKVEASKWLVKFHSTGLPRTTAGQLLQQAMQFGAINVESFVPGTLRTAVARTQYDLYCVLSRSCREWPLAHREAAENLAYSILFTNQEG